MAGSLPGPPLQAERQYATIGVFESCKCEWRGYSENAGRKGEEAACSTPPPSPSHCPINPRDVKVLTSCHQTTAAERFNSIIEMALSSALGSDQRGVVGEAERARDCFIALVDLLAARPDVVANKYVGRLPWLEVTEAGEEGGGRESEEI
eukprot:768715-Hanusia_phi.AAC.16